MPMNIFIYRPDRGFNRNVKPECCYTLRGKSYHEWQKDQDEAYAFKVEIIKKKLTEKKSSMIEDYWR